MTTWYDILQVSTKASSEVIEMAYKALVKKYHPDLQTEEGRSTAEEKMKLLNQAREILTDPDLRKQYDVFLAFQQQIDKTKAERKAPSAPYKKKSKFEIYKGKFVDSVSKWPDSVRWIISFPVFILTFYLCYTILYLLYHNTFGYLDKNNVVWTIISQPLCFIPGLYLLNIFIPRNKFISMIIVSSIVAVIITNPIYSVITNSVEYTALSFIQCILSDILTIPILIYVCILAFKKEYIKA